MTDVLLALCVGLAFALGYLPMKRLDRFLEKNRAAIEGREREVPVDVPAETCEGRAQRARAFRRGVSPSAGWRWGRLLPLRHRG